LPSLRSSASATPLPAYLLRFATLYGIEEEVLRLPAAIAGVAAVAMAMLLLRALFGARAALAAGLVLSTLPLHVAISQAVSPLPLAAAAGLLAAWLAWRLLRGESRLWTTAAA